MAEQTSFRLPREMLRELGRMARQRGVPKSQLVREALELYLASPDAGQASPQAVRERSAPFIGSINLSAKRAAAAEISVRVRRNNWRD